MIDKYTVGTVMYLIVIVIFCLLFYQNFDSTYNKSYIAVDDDQNCKVIPTLVNIALSFDNYGTWSTSADYHSSEALYVTTFNNFKTTQTYKSLINTILDDIDTFSDNIQLPTYNLAQNLLISMTYIDFISGIQEYTQTTGEASIVLGELNIYSTVALSSVAGRCPYTGSLVYDSTSNKLINTWNKSNLIDHPVCLEAIYIHNIPLIKNGPRTNNYYHDFLVYEFDVNSFTIATSINMGFLNLNNVYFNVDISNIDEFYYNNVGYRMIYYSDLRYNMQSILCIHNTTIIPISENTIGIEQLCFIVKNRVIYGYVLSLPIYNHMGTNFKTPSYCDCDNNNGNCNHFNLMSTLLDYKSFVNESFTIVQQIKQYMNLVNSHSSYQNFSKLAYNAAFYSYGTSSASTTTISSAKEDKLYRKAYDFCNISNILKPENYLSCSLFTVFHIGIKVNILSQLLYMYILSQLLYMYILTQLLHTLLTVYIIVVYYNNCVIILTHHFIYFMC